ncbi:iron(III) transport system substrate-binding protein [Dethiosulfatibacter aminovorans DSM 17477]|uniref:Iron(III) transport system substrate-binding protein n=1 Tax=Dethiosulfatibacter aminovorans DSM 17477 TaxID=1121476 RepID=A0A1M6AS66_9FIRM|nr:ABC transporter substrate-binding protein [Dethiosulfatibacter aminovorans]SHI39053.1 iron(III) transport system substrate-binding protein [Dethiosulfatibacter aminovorans DSM 17477]
MKLKGKRIVVFILALMMVLSLAACNGTEETPAEPESSEVESAPEAVENQETETEEPEDDLGWSSEFYDREAMEGKTLNMYGVTDKIIPVLEAFTEDTGIVVENLTMKNGEILQRLINEKDSGVVIADIWFTGGADTFISAAQDGLLHPYKSPEGEILDDIMKDKDGYWHGTSLTLVNWVVNKQLIEEKGLKMPESWDDLLQEGLAGEVSMSNPASSGTAYNTVSAILQVRGEEEGWDYLDKLIQQVPFFTARGSDPANMVVNGEAIVGINASNGDRELEINNSHIKLVYPSDGTGWWPQPVAIVEGTENLDEAKVFVDWLLSRKGMETIANVRYAAVARNDLAIPEGIVDINDINLFPVDFQANAENRDGILEQWASHVE